MSAQIPVYYHDGQYAREHGELEQYRASHKANIECRVAIERAIARNFDGWYLDHQAIDDVFGQYSAERIALVLAATVQAKDWDGRFSRANKAWAASVMMPERAANAIYDRRDDYVVSTHPAVLEGFINLARNDMIETR